MFPVSRTIDRFDATFDHDGLIANAGLIMIATLMSRLGLQQLADKWVRTGFAPGRKICTLIAAMVAGATHIDHVDVLRAGATQTMLPFRVMASSTIGTFLRYAEDAFMPSRWVWCLRRAGFGLIDSA